MKKLLFVAIIGALVSCGEATTATDKVDSTVSAAVDSAAVKIDSAGAGVDSAVAKADSTIKAVVDSVKK
jgi:hypothetical protein